MRSNQAQNESEIKLSWGWGKSEINERMRERVRSNQAENESEIKPSRGAEGNPIGLHPLSSPVLVKVFLKLKNHRVKPLARHFRLFFPPLPDPVGLSVCLSVWVLGCLSACLFSCLSVWLATGQPVCLVAVKTKDWVQLLKSPHQCKCTLPSQLFHFHPGCTLQSISHNTAAA